VSPSRAARVVPLLSPAVALLMACDGAHDPVRGGGGGKADVGYGSCLESDCAGIAASGACYCDDACLEYGDCCADHGELCRPGPAAFSVTTVASAGDIGDAPALVLDRAGGPRIAFHDFDSQGAAIRLADEVAGGWSIPRVTDDDDAVVAPRSALALGPDGEPHVVYQVRHGHGTALAYRSLVEGSFRRALIDAAPAALAPERRGADPAIAIGPDGAVHVVSVRHRVADGAARAELRHVWHDGERWQFEPVAAVVGGAAGWARASALSMDDSGALHLSFSDPAEGVIRHAIRRPSGWQVEVVAPYEADGSVEPHLALGEGGVAHVVFTSGTVERRIVHAVGRGGVYVSETLAADAPPPASNQLDVAVDAAGVAHVAFQADRRLYHVRAGGAPAVVVDGDLDVGGAPSIAIGPDGAIHVAYHDEAGQDLRHARR
jgi:hypothetical protein